MTLYKVIAEQKIIKKVLVVVDADSNEDAMNKVRDGKIISAEKSLDTKIGKYTPIKAEKYE